MPQTMELETPRLRLRQWRASDREPFAAMNADPAVMEFFAGLQSRAASDASIDAWQAQFQERGWSNWAVELRSTGTFIGFVGLSVPRRVLPFSPCVEVGWRLARASWGFGFATEAARASLRFGFEQLALPDIVSFTSVLNLRSRAVMERIGMHDTHQDFDHPALPEGSALRRHCLYRLTREQWLERVTIPAHLRSFWSAFAATAEPGAEDRFYEAFHFGDHEKLANALGQLVLQGAKRATASSVWVFEAEGKRPPRRGDLSIVTDWAGAPLCVIETESVDVLPFHAVGAEFAACEGEGDGSLAYWRAAHRKYFGRECARIGRSFSEDMPVACERFEVVFRAPGPL